MPWRADVGLHVICDIAWASGPLGPVGYWHAPAPLYWLAPHMGANEFAGLVGDCE